MQSAQLVDLRFDGENRTRNEPNELGARLTDGQTATTDFIEALTFRRSASE